MAAKATITRRFALLGVLAASVAATVPVEAVPVTTADDTLMHLSSETLARVLVETFDSGTVDQQMRCIRDLRSVGGRVAEIGDVLERRFNTNWQWVPTHIPGLAVPSNTLQHLIS